MVDHPDPDANTPGGYDRGSDGMPDRTRRAFQSHADSQLGEKPSDARSELRRVFRTNEDAVVACSGGKDSLTTLALASEADAEHRALHWDWGGRLVPRDLEQEIVECIRAFVPDEQLFVAARHPAASSFQRYTDADRFQELLSEHDGITETDGSLTRLAGALQRSDSVGVQIVGLRAGESGSRERSVSGGLYGESLGQRAAFPIRDWSARDVWAFFVDRDVDYPSYYDRVAHSVGDGSPKNYERARLATVHDPEFEDYSADGLAAWRDHDIKHPYSE